MLFDTMAPPDQALIRRWQKMTLALALLCEVFLAADWYALAAVLPFISESLNLNEGQAGFAQGIFALTYGLGMLVWSPVSRRMSARNMLLLGLAGTGLGMILQANVQSFAQLVALRLFIGFFDAAIFIGNIKLIFGWFPQARRGAIVGMILAAYSLAITLDFALGIPLTLAAGWRFFFGVLAAGTVLMAVLVVALVRDTPAGLGFAGFAWEADPAVTRSLGFSEVFRSRVIAIGAVGIAACTFAISGTATWVVPGYIGIQGMAVELAPVIGTLMGLSQVVFLIIGGYVADRMEKTAVIRIGILMALATAVLFTGAMLWQMPLAVLVLLAGLSGIAVFGGGAVFALMSERYDVSLAPAAVGYAEVFGVLASFVAPWMMGAIIHAGGGAFWQAFAAFAVVEVLLLGLFSALVAGLVRRPRPVHG